MADPIKPDDISSPRWQPGTRLVVGVMVSLIVIILLYVIRNLVLSVIIAFLIAYMLDPVVTWLVKRARFPRWLATFIVIVLFIAILFGAITGIGFAFSQRVNDLINLFSSITEEIPSQLEQIGQLQFSIGPWDFDLSGISVEPLISNLASSISPLLSQAGSLFGSVAIAAASFITSFFLDMVITFYLLLDFKKLRPAFLRLIPKQYENDFALLLEDGDRIWRAFLRGYVILALIIGVAVFVTMTIAGLDFPLVMGLIGGLLEMVPMFGPVISAIIGGLIAVIQPTNPWGLTPIAFALVILGILTMIQQVENTILVPRIMGESLRLHPLAVFLAVIAGGALAGFFGILLASPTLATLRLVFGYIYSKVVDVEAPRTSSFEPAEPREPPSVAKMREAVLSAWNRLREMAEESVED
ncbi:MAG: AI-2E family transporter [Anaerolineales bacterium]|jgi:predicted PurR-regulated permease PerM